MYDTKPTRCIDPVMKHCQECQLGWVKYPAWVETAEDLSWCMIESGCTLGFEKDEPTEEELKEFEEWRNRIHLHKKFGYCPICDDGIEAFTNDSMCYCPTCGHHVILHEE